MNSLFIEWGVCKNEVQKSFLGRGTPRGEGAAASTGPHTPEVKRGGGRKGRTLYMQTPDRPPSGGMYWYHIKAILSDPD